MKFWPEIYSSDAYSVSTANGTRSSGAVVACVQKIVSRAVEIPFMSSNPAAERVLRDPSWLLSVDREMFWRRVYEGMLYDGEVAVYRTASGKLRVGKTDGSAIITGDGAETRVSRSFRTRRMGDEDEETFDVQDTDICRLFWAEDGMTPWRLIQKEAAAYAESTDDLYQEAQKARRMAAEVDINEALQEIDQLDEKLDEFQQALKNGQKQRIYPFPKGVNIKPVQFGHDAPHDERLRVSLAGIARVYGVPLQLLNAGVDRQTVDEADAHLLRDAVVPLVRSVASGLTKVFRADVQPDMRKVGLPSRTGIAGLMMKLSQTGVLTINEIREQVGYPPMEGGDEFPETAGAGSRSESGNDDENQA